MPLEKYVEKRDFDRTPEPAGGDPSLTLPRFVVQLHKATRLHYDFRLEVDGVLKSWAVPKGPSMNPDDKRLAMMVEDHPMDYRLFEGIIPKGNYGAGTVMVWDEGEYTVPEGDDPEIIGHAIRLGLHKGHCAFALRGKKLHGIFDIIKVRGRNGEENAWLLVKRKDETASESNVLEQDRSVLTGRSLTEIAERASQAGEVWFSNQGDAAIDVEDAPRGPMPQSVQPMLAKEVAEPFDRQGWLFEVKWDGYRAIARVQPEAEVSICSRNGLSLNDQYPQVVDALRLLGHAAVLDGEIVVVDEQGKSHFQRLQEYQSRPSGTLIYYVFDILFLDGHDLQGLPLRRRKEILKQLIGEGGRVRVSDHIDEEGTALFEVVKATGLEGMMAKNAGSTYLQGKRSSDWLKVKALNTTFAVVGGYTEPRGGRQHFGALVLGMYEGKSLSYAGHTGGGFDDARLRQVIDLLEPLQTPTCPFESVPKTNAPVHWVEPKVVCEIELRGWTSAGIMRQPVFRRLAPEVEAVSVVREEAAPVVATPPSKGNRRFGAKSSDVITHVDGRRLKLTNLDKVLWPEEGYTKGDLISYYREVCEYILPYLKDRPESLHRHPNGIDQKGFFQKDMPAETPDWIQTCSVYSPTHGKDVRYLVCQEEATLIYLANLACIEINPWSSRTHSLDRPDFIVLDLDPLDIDFKYVVECANITHAILTDLEIPSYCKTTGSRGMHIYIPMESRYTYQQAKQFAELLARLVHSQYPAVTSLERMPAKRRGKIYLDFLQNRDGQTLAAPYSARPKPHGTVSTPLLWEEVNEHLNPRAFTIKTISKRLSEVGDLWKPVLEQGVDMGAVLEDLGRSKYAPGLAALA